MPGECDWELVVQDVVLGFKIRGVECEDAVERGWAWMQGQHWMVAQELGETTGRQGMLGRDIEGRT